MTKKEWREIDSIFITMDNTPSRGGKVMFGDKGVMHKAEYGEYFVPYAQIRYIKFKNKQND